MSTVQGTVTASLQFAVTPATSFPIDTAVSSHAALRMALASGTAADKVDKHYAATLAFLSATPQTLDLTSLTDMLGAALSFAKVRLIAIKVYSTADAASLTIGGAVSNAWEAFLSAAGTLKVSAASVGNPDGGFFLLTAPNTTGWAVDGSHKSLLLTPSAHAFNVDIILSGTSV